MNDKLDEILDLLRSQNEMIKDIPRLCERSYQREVYRRIQNDKLLY